MSKIEQCYDCFPNGCKIGKLVAEIKKGVPEKVSPEDAKEALDYVLEKAILGKQPCPEIVPVNPQETQSSSPKI